MRLLRPALEQHKQYQLSMTKERIFNHIFPEP